MPRSTFDSVERIVVADLNESSAQDFAAQLNNKVSSMGLDVSDDVALRKAMANSDLVINTCGPFYRYGVPVLQAAIDTGCHYVDICDDWEPTVEMLKLDQQAKDADVCAIVGLGASPGISNMLALIGDARTRFRRYFVYRLGPWWRYARGRVFSSGC
jgi:saccharopine dehydrogenase-like NADP-dependent oxidoreductase